jgi:NAD(P)-dependent dehydrogenase (short-subunit alcohol dehydrogenase family)
MNFVGPSALTGKLLLRANAPARCVNVVSAGFKLWKLDPFQDLRSTQRYVSGDAYAHTKLLNVLFSLALAKRLAADQVTVNLVHPGMSWTQMTKSMTSQTIPSLRLVWPRVDARSPRTTGSAPHLVLLPFFSVRDHPRPRADGPVLVGTIGPSDAGWEC